MFYLQSSPKYQSTELGLSDCSMCNAVLFQKGVGDTMGTKPKSNYLATKPGSYPKSNSNTGYDFEGRKSWTEVKEEREG